MHLVWTTENRFALINRRAAEYLDEHLRIIARQERARVLELGIVATHVHMLVRVHPTTIIPRLLQRLKGGTSAQLPKPPAAQRHSTGWSRGYNVQSVSRQALEVVRAYVRNQAAHHPADAISCWVGGRSGDDFEEPDFVPVASATPAERSL